MTVMTPVYLVKYVEKSGGNVQFFELPYEERMDIAQLKELVKESIHPEAELDVQVNNSYIFKAKGRFFSVVVELSAKIDSRYFKLEEINVA